MEEIKKAIMSGVSERPEVGVSKPMTPTASAILLLVLVLGARQNLRNDDNITITADDVQGIIHCPLLMIVSRTSLSMAGMWIVTSTQ